VSLDRIGELWDTLLDAVWAVRQWIDFQAGRLGVHPAALAAAAALLILAPVLLIWFLRRRARASRSGYLVGDSPVQRRKAVQSIQRTLEDLRRDEPQFVDLVHSILKRCPLERLLEQDEIEVAFGRLTFLFEKRSGAAKNRGSMLSLSGGSRDRREKRAAMVTLIRSCYASDAVYSALDEKARTQVDRFLDGL
jgi:hypothetical protein